MTPHALPRRGSSRNPVAFWTTVYKNAIDASRNQSIDNHLLPRSVWDRECSNYILIRYMAVSFLKEAVEPFNFPMIGVLDNRSCVFDCSSF